MAGSKMPSRSLPDTREMIGDQIERLDRVQFFDGVRLEPDAGALEVTFRQSGSWLLDAAADGESLSLRRQKWVDPFGEELSPENRAFVDRSGRWVRVPVSEAPGYASLVGQVVTQVLPLENRFGRLAGLALVTRSGTLWFIVEADEGFVRWALPEGFQVAQRAPSATPG